MKHLEQTRLRRPYEKKSVNKSSALVFGLGLGAVLAIMALVIGLAIPSISSRMDNLTYRARSYYRKLLPHPQYLPTPAPVVSMSVTLRPTNPVEEPSQEQIPADVQLASEEAVPAADSRSSDMVLMPVFPPTPAPTATVPTPVEALQPISGSIELDGVTHQWQTWNNCGPATVTMNMSFFGRTENQADAARFLKPNRDDKNVSPDEMAAYVRSAAPNLQAVVRRGGSLEQVKQLLSNDVPVLAETWLVHEGDGLGHYRLITGYNDAAGQLTTFDSLNGPSYKVSYEQFEADWRVFNRLYIIVFPPEQAETVWTIIGPDADEQTMYERVLASARTEAEANPNEAIAYFNIGEALTHLGRYEEATMAFDKARTLGLHWRRLWYQFTPFEAYYSTGRYQDVLDLTEATLKGAGGLEEAYYYHGLALLATGQPGAEKDFQAALNYNPHFTPAEEALNQLVEQR